MAAVTAMVGGAVWWAQPVPDRIVEIRHATLNIALETARPEVDAYRRGWADKLGILFARSGPFVVPDMDPEDWQIGCVTYAPDVVRVTLVPR